MAFHLAVVPGEGQCSENRALVAQQPDGESPQLADVAGFGRLDPLVEVLMPAPADQVAEALRERMRLLNLLVGLAQLSQDGLFVGRELVRLLDE